MRTNKIFLVVGGRGTGKTTWLENNVPTTAAVVELFKTDRYGNFSNRLMYQNFRLAQCQNKPVILEDATQIITGNGTLQLRRLAVSCKQLGCDVYIVFHSLNYIPPFLFAMFDYIVLFKSEPARKTAKLLPYFDEITKLQAKKPRKYQPIGVIEQV